MSGPGDLGGLGRRGYLLVRGGGVLWGVENAAVRGLARRGSGFRISVGERTLSVDEVLGVVPDLAVRPVARVLRRFWPEPAGGVAVHAEAPLVIVDPRLPPHVLVEGDVENDEGRG